MQVHTLQSWIARHIAVRHRLEKICGSYLLLLMVVTQKRSLEAAARCSGRNKSGFSKFLKHHGNVAVTTLEDLAKKQAKHVSKTLQALHRLPWKIALRMDSTLQHRASLHPENAKKFNHGTGFVIGHQWTNVLLIINDLLIPLRPIPYYNKQYCMEHDLDYQTEHELVVDYINH